VGRFPQPDTHLASTFFIDRTCYAAPKIQETHAERWRWL
jgi:hypothetical protein